MVKLFIRDDNSMVEQVDPDYGNQDKEKITVEHEFQIRSWGPDRDRQGFRADCSVDGGPILKRGEGLSRRFGLCWRS